MNKITLPGKFRYIYKIFKNEEFKILDIGCGNNSAAKTKLWFPKCIYHGLDKVKDYNNLDSNFELMEKFYEVDLTICQLDEIPNEFFDVIMMTHVIEHLSNGDVVLVNLLSKLKEGGYFYIEYPSFKSTKFPSMKGTLNFFDDSTHCRLYSQLELYNLFLKNNCKIIKGGVRRDSISILLTPIRAIQSLIRSKYLKGSVFWDLLGFAEFIIVQKNQH